MTDHGPRPAWMARAVREVERVPAEWFQRFTPPPGHERQAAVLMLFATCPDSSERLSRSTPAVLVMMSARRRRSKLSPAVAVTDSDDAVPEP